MSLSKNTEYFLVKWADDGEKRFFCKKINDEQLLIIRGFRYSKCRRGEILNINILLIPDLVRLSINEAFYYLVGGK